MALVTAPSTVLQKWSAWADVASIAVGALVLMVPALGELLSPKQMAGTMALLSALALGLKYLKQNIPVTAEQKEALIEAVEAAPTKLTEGQR